MNDEMIPGGDNIPVKACIKCGNPDIVKDAPNALCVECRTSAIKFPIPLWVKLFAGGIVLLLLFSLINLPQSLTLGVVLEKGIHAADENKYVTAQHYFEEAVKLDSDNVEANAHLLIAAYYNNNMLDFLKAGERLSGKNLDDDVLLAKVNTLAARTDYYFASDSFYSIQQQYAPGDNIPDSIYERFAREDNHVYEQTLYTNILFDRKNYRACDSLAHVILNIDGENMPVLGIMGSAKRFEDQPDSAVYYCDKLLAMNNEFSYATCLKARALLKLKKNEEALQLVMDSKRNDSANVYTLATLALVYHFSNKPAQRDAVLLQAEKNLSDSTDIQVFQYVHDVMNNKESL